MNESMRTASRFWLVVNPERIDSHPPTYRHTSYESARDEAHRLASQHPNEQFHVMASIAAMKKSDVSEVIFENDPTCPYIDVPF